MDETNMFQETQEGLIECMLNMFQETQEGRIECMLICKSIY